MTKHEELLALRQRIAQLAATKALRAKNQSLLTTLRDQEIQLHLSAVDELSDQKRSKRTQRITYERGAS